MDGARSDIRLGIRFGIWFDSWSGARPRARSGARPAMRPQTRPDAQSEARSDDFPAPGGVAAVLGYLVRPEDVDAPRRIPGVRPATRALLRACKTGLWFALAVASVLALGQLH